jgi:hypothetical protein
MVFVSAEAASSEVTSLHCVHREDFLVVLAQLSEDVNVVSQTLDYGMVIV